MKARFQCSPAATALLVASLALLVYLSQARGRLLELSFSCHCLLAASRQTRGKMVLKLCVSQLFWGCCFHDAQGAVNMVRS